MFKGATNDGVCNVDASPRRATGKEKIVMLAPEDELRAVADVASRLAMTFPDVNPVDVKHVVEQSHELFTGTPIRDFVPVLVERIARQDLLAKRRV
jgi:hypothetical protein